MLVKQYKDMLGTKSVIRTLAEFAAKRGGEIGYENVFDYSLGNPSVPVPERFNESCARLLRENRSGLHGYSPSLGIPEVRERIADSLNRRFGMNYRAEHIFMASGAAGALAHAFRLVAQAGEEIITFAPFFPEYVPYVNLSGAALKVVPPRTGDFQIDEEALEALINPKTRAVLVNTPNNPSGALYSEGTLKGLAALLEKKSGELGRRIYLISDEPYREIVFGGGKAPYVSHFYDYTISCYSFSKSLSLPGERIGYVAANPACPEAEEMILMCGQISRGIGHNCPASLIQLAVAENLEETADLSVYERNAALLYGKLMELGFSCVRPQGTFYLFPRALEEDAGAFCRKALACDLILVPGDSFGCPGHFRMAYCIGTEKVERSFAALERFVAKEYGDRRQPG